MKLGRTLHTFNPSLAGVEDVARRRRVTPRRCRQSPRRAVQENK